MQQTEYRVTENVTQRTAARRCYSIQNPRVLDDYAEVVTLNGSVDCLVLGRVADRDTIQGVIDEALTGAASWAVSADRADRGSQEAA